MPIALPIPGKQRRAPAEPSAARQRKRSKLFRLVLLLIMLGALLAAFLSWRAQASTPAAPTTTSAPITRANLEITVENSGKVQPARSVHLPFQSEGQVREVLVKPNDHVAAGQVLARLDDRALLLVVQQAEADLKTAQAGLDKARSGSATPADIAQAQARLNASAAELQKTRTGNVTAADLREAEASLHAAQARLNALRDPSPDKRSTAELTLTQAQTNLERTRDQLSAAKTSAQLALAQTTSALTQAQSSYATAFANWRYVQDSGNDPLNPTTTGANGKQIDNKLNDSQRQQYYDAFVRAEAALRSAEDGVQQAQVAYDAARQQEIVGVQEAEAKLSDAQRQLNALVAPRPTDLAEAQAEVSRAQAQLEKLRQGGTRADVSAAQAHVDEARAGLDELTAPVAASDIAIAEADLAQAQAKLDAAKLKLDSATLTAPFAGTLATVDVVPGNVVSAATQAFTIVDDTSIHLDMNVSESDVARIKPGGLVRITFDTLPDKEFDGSVTSIAVTGKEDQNIVTYLVQAQFDPKSAPIKLGMTANASLEVDRRENVIQVPSAAITGDGPVKSIQLLYGKDKPPLTILVETGASNGTMTEIVRCVDTNNMCLRESDQVLINVGSDAAAAGNGSIRFGGPPGPAMRTIRIGGP
jgi:HlyD family secretion protein